MGGRGEAATRMWTQARNRRWWVVKTPRPRVSLDLRPLTRVHAQRPAHMRPLVPGGGPEISSKNKEIKSALIKSHAGIGGPERLCHLPAALIVHS